MSFWLFPPFSVISLSLFLFFRIYSVKQSDRNSSKTDRFHKTTTYEQHVYTSSEQNIDTNMDE